MSEDANSSSDSLVTAIRDAGVAGAGGAGFPAYAKWEHLDEVHRLLMNHEESGTQLLLR